MINATNWKELRKQLKQIQSKAVFKLERVDSMNDGTFYRVLHQVKPHELVFFDGKQQVYLQVNTEIENKIVYFENGFRIGNCTYILHRIMEV
ncbi:Uncharacterised protein [uncultured Eubacterium sp.]|jgi:hypothetical protein|nr:Uncharacterised protein [uncultured Eubacterium sp.]